MRQLHAHHKFRARWLHARQGNSIDGAYTLNPIDALEIIPSGEQEEEKVGLILEQWRPDPFHPTS
jgi:hypothetical protein